jgi:hypothetical protein
LGQENELVDQWAQISSGPPRFNFLGSTSLNHPSYADNGSSSVSFCASPIEDYFGKDSNWKKVHNLDDLSSREDSDGTFKKQEKLGRWISTWAFT